MEREVSKTELSLRPDEGRAQMAVGRRGTLTVAWPAISLRRAPWSSRRRGRRPPTSRRRSKSFGASSATTTASAARSRVAGARSTGTASRDAFAAPNDLPANFFNVNSPRGVVFFTPGAGFQVSAKRGSRADRVRQSSSGRVAQVRHLQSPSGCSRRSRARSRRSSSSCPAPRKRRPARGSAASSPTWTGDDSTKIEYFDVNGALLFSGFVPAAEGNETLSFLGVAFDAGEEVFLVRITSGDVELGGTSTGEAATSS